MKEVWEAYTDNTPVFSLGDLVSLVFLVATLSSGVAVWKSFLLYIVFYTAYHFVRGFIKGVYNSLTNPSK